MNMAKKALFSALLLLIGVSYMAPVNAGDRPERRNVNLITWDFEGAEEPLEVEFTIGRTTVGDLKEKLREKYGNDREIFFFPGSQKDSEILPDDYIYEASELDREGNQIFYSFD